MSTLLVPNPVSVAAREAEHPVQDFFLQRWSPRSFSGETLDKATLFSFFEAARWTPSANNSQPWRFIYALRDSEHWATLFDLLNENNQRWAANASALVVLVSKTTHVRKGNTEATPLRSHALDAGAAWASLAFQAEFSGWRTHAIGGFDRGRAVEVLGIPEGYHVNVAIAIGRQAALTALPEDLQAREQPSARKPLRELIAEGRFHFAE